MKLRIVFMSHTADGGVFRVGSHHLSREMSKRGHEVAHVSTPISAAHLAKAFSHPESRRRLRSAGRLRRDTNGVAHLVPATLLPLGKTPLPLRRLDARMRSAWWASRAPSLVSPDIVYLDQPLLIDLAKALAPRILVYRPTDAHFDPRARAAELEALAVADAIAATSPKTLELVIEGTDWSGPSTVIENGVEFDRFSQGQEPSSRRGIVYVGALDARFDWDLLRKLATSFPAERFDILGPLSTAAPELPANVTLHGPVPYEEVPRFLRSASVGLLPLSNDPANASRSPMKYYEYLASGLSVLATDVPSLRDRSGRNVWLYDSPGQAESYLAEALESSPQDRNAGVDFARLHSWASCTSRLLEFTTALEAPGENV